MKDYLGIRVTMNEVEPEELDNYRETLYTGDPANIKKAYDCKVEVRSSALSTGQLKGCAMALQETLIKLALEDKSGAFMAGLMSVAMDKLNKEG